MTALVFVDTNIFIYAKNDADEQKRTLARQWLEVLWREQPGRTSVKVLNEYYALLTQRAKFKVSRELAWDVLRALFEWKPQEIDVDVLDQAFNLEGRFGLNWWGCLDIAAAQVQGCSMLLTEDLQQGQRFDGVVITNSFKLGVAEVRGAYPV